jgi:hypothetical protein
MLSLLSSDSSSTNHTHGQWRNYLRQLAEAHKGLRPLPIDQKSLRPKKFLEKPLKGALRLLIHNPVIDAHAGFNGQVSGGHQHIARKYHTQLADVMYLIP